MTQRPVAPPPAHPPSARPQPPAPPPPRPTPRAAPPSPPPPQFAPQKRSPRATIPQAIEMHPVSGYVACADRIVEYGTGGVGKSTLAAFLPSPLFFDLDNETRKLPVMRESIASWSELRGKLAKFEASPIPGVQSIVIDNVTVAEEMAKEHVVATRTTEKGRSVDSIEGYGWGKGWQFVYDEFNGLLADLDRINAKGIVVCLIAHVVQNPVPNPGGEDWTRWEPLLYNGDKKGRGSVRERVKNWADHVLFIGYDVYVAEGKGQGSGSRTIYTSELPTHVAKSRVRALSIPYDLSDPSAVWRELGIMSSAT